MQARVAIIGVGYVGIQNAITISKAGIPVIAFDINEQRIASLKAGIDNNHEVSSFTNPNLIFTSDHELITQANYYLISVPTPINIHKVPNTYPLKSAAELLAHSIKKGDVIILESTVYPGTTRTLLIPILEQYSNLKSGVDFYVGYSSERIVPGESDSQQLNNTKVISGQNTISLKKIKKLYKHVFTMNLHIAPSLEVAEASKLLENIQRDVNIALMNEFAQIMEKMEIPYHEVRNASKTKWNFLPFTPGLVGGHCIPEDPYYLIYQANKTGALSNLISCARQVNEQFYHFIQETLIKKLTSQRIHLNNARVAILGISFKANVADSRHSLSIVLYRSLVELGINAIACDPLVEDSIPDLHWVSLNRLKNCDAIILCQAHKKFIEFGNANLDRSADLEQNSGKIRAIPGLLV